MKDTKNIRIWFRQDGNYVDKYKDFEEVIYGYNGGFLIINFKNTLGYIYPLDDIWHIEKI